MQEDGLKLKTETQCALLCWITQKYILEFKQIKEKSKVQMQTKEENGRFSFSKTIFQVNGNGPFKKEMGLYRTFFFQYLYI